MAGPIRIAILANGRQARNEAALTARAYSGLGRTLKTGAAAVGLTALASKAIGFTKASIDLEAKYSTTMRTIQASSGASGRAMGKLNDLAIQLGRDTAFSANDAADAMLELSKAGINTRDIMGGGVAGTLQLAAAGGTELGTAATIASNAMNAFNLSGRDMDSIAAALAGGANASTASVESLGQALSQVGPGAVNAGLSLQETIGALSAFDAAGIKGSDAGTTLKTMLARLIPASERAENAMEALGLQTDAGNNVFVKANGEFESLQTIAGQLQKRLGGLSAAQRTTALNTIFGSDASRAATVLMKQGAGGIRDFVKATRDQGAAQKMAAARMGGTAGAMERMSGAIETAQLRLGQELAPAVQKTADLIGNNMGPAMEGAIDAGKAFVDAVEPAAKILKKLGEVAVDAVKFVDGLPGPVKQIGIQAGIAALIMPRLAAGVTSVTGSLTLNIARLQQWRAEMTYGVTRAQALSTAMTRLGGAAKAAAGIGGMVALQQASETTNKKMKVLGYTAGGAALGFSMGGPWGAALGGLSGGLYGLYDTVKDVNQGWEEAKAPAKDYASTLDQVTGAATKATRAMVLQSLQENDLVQVGNSLGVSTRDMIDAALGNANAASRIGKAWQNTGTVLDGLQNQKLSSWLADQGFKIRQNEAEIRKNRDALTSWATALNGVRPKVQTRLETLGYELTRKQLRGLDRQYDLTARERRIILREIGIEPARRKARGLNQDLGKVGKVKPSGKWANLYLGDVRRVQNGSKRANASLGKIGNAKPSNRWVTLFGADLRRGRSVADKGAGVIGRTLKGSSAKWRPNMDPFNVGIRTGLTTAKSTASSGGHQVGADLKAGVISGFSGTLTTLSNMAASAVSAAVAAARRAADAHSPSRKMAALGRDLGDGLVVGMAARRRHTETAARTLVEGTLAAARTGARGGTALDFYLSTNAERRQRAEHVQRTRAGGVAITITNWETGEGYMRGIARDEIDDADMMSAQIARAG